ncbi:nucleoside triphosphatase YtkD [Bacillus sp. MUM 116]|nr:nucleoside triphosphatase YtkD [Bacillus sp. MUM 116]OIK12820.1 nucleoside triphosphatase YtkD [Bacillus sp. MUM 116]
MIEFIDQNGNKVELSFSEKSFPEIPKHVLVICQYEDGWVLTHHKKRGFEFPGGKMETGETLEDAARREVFEETGAVLGELIKIGEYRVTDPKGKFVKAVFHGNVDSISKTNTYYETNGPVFIKGDLLQKRFEDEFSFIMKDQVVEECLKHIDNGIKN